MKRQKPSTRKVSAKKAGLSPARKQKAGTKRKSPRKTKRTTTTKTRKAVKKTKVQPRRKTSLRKAPPKRSSRRLPRRSRTEAGEQAVISKALVPETPVDLSHQKAAAAKSEKTAKPKQVRRVKRKEILEPSSETLTVEATSSKPAPKPKRRTTVRKRPVRTSKKIAEIEPLELLPGTPAVDGKAIENAALATEATEEKVREAETVPTDAKPEEAPALPEPAVHEPVDLTLLTAVAAHSATAETSPTPPRVPPSKEKQSSQKRSKSPSLPAILLEGDEPEGALLHGPGQKYAISAGQPEQRSGGALAFTKATQRLPASYDTGRLVLLARDPRCLHAQWDLSEKQQRLYNSLSGTGHLSICVFRDSPGGPIAARVEVHPESRDWFVHVDTAGETYVAQLGYQRRDGEWVAIATSGVASTPPVTRSEQRRDVFACVPLNVPLSRIQSPLPAAKLAPVAEMSEKMQDVVEASARPSAWLGQAISLAPFQGAMFEVAPGLSEGITEIGHFAPARPDMPSPGLPPGAQWHAPVLEWTPAQEQALTEFIQTSLVRHEWMGSAEIAEMIRRGEQRPALDYRPELGEIEGISEFAEGLPSSPTAQGPPPQQGFWFNLNAELVIYGSTESNASVTIGGRPIRLRPDGSFSYRFALPDGNYQLPVVAVSPEGTDVRAALLDFSRQTSYEGAVGAHPQDPALKPPTPENLPS
jgi:hypothetical protein